MNLHQRATLAGIACHYVDIWGKSHDVSDEILIKLLDAMGYDEEASKRLLPFVKTLPAGEECHLPLNMSTIATDATLTLEDGSTQPCVIENYMVHLPSMPMGYHRLTLNTEDTLIIAAPSTCWLPEIIAKGEKIWGIATQLYGLRSESNWGIGDFSDLLMLVQAGAKAGAGTIGLSPLHALFPSNPLHISPYSPSSRLYLNYLYLDVTKIAGYSDISTIAPLIQKARDNELVDYEMVAQCKRQALEVLFKATEKDQAFIKFREDGGLSIEKYALFEALSEHFSQHNIHDWRQWPNEFHHPQAEAVLEFANTHQERIEFFIWLQWQAHLQLSAVQQAAKDAHMPIGLYGDLAVGASSNGAEIWMSQELFVSHMAIGAPPDSYNKLGQNWGLPPLNPHILQQQAYKPFIELVRANMRYTGALRIDHAFGLSRLYWVPEGMGADKGAYVHYPFDDLLAILRLESHRNKCMVIGEDLGTFPPGYFEAALESGLLSYRLLYFEKDNAGFKKPDDYPQLALTAISTHDLPTFNSWWQANDISLREHHHLYPSEELIKYDQQQRETDKKQLLAAFESENLSQDNLMESAQAYLARSNAALVMVQLEDILMLTEQANLPNTTDEHPNWRRKLPQTVAQIMEGESMHHLALVMNQERKHHQPLFMPPIATYRLQLHKEFTFSDAVAIIPYLKQLGISHVYASSYLKARPGSTHGYDIIDYNQFNPELGGEEGYKVFTEALRAHGLKHILDFVPNHMGVGGADNSWWLSVLEWGENSPYADYFDIDWKPRFPGNDKPKLVIPFLGDHYGNVLDNGELQLRFDQVAGSFAVWHADQCFPICPATYHLIDTNIPKITTVEDGEKLKQQLIREYKTKVDITKDQLHQLLEAQSYRLAFWRVASHEINYRRFFEIKELAGMRMENTELFDKSHELVISLFKKGELDGLRIDHIDGLADPAGYLQRLRSNIGEHHYLIIEKILASHESLRHWPVQGTSGYDALNLINGLFVLSRNKEAIEQAYEEFIGSRQDFSELVYQAKKLILTEGLASELRMLTLGLKRIADSNYHTRDYTYENLREALKDIIAYFPIYRSYITHHHIDKNDSEAILWAMGMTRKHSKFADSSLLSFIHRLLLTGYDSDDEEVRNFIRRFQQLTSPTMAKGMEDTSFYQYNRLLSLNEVGGNPQQFGISVTAFHFANSERLKTTPHAMITSSTHDTKRGEDARMRINMIAEDPARWADSIKRWSQLNRSYRTENAPSPADEYFIYQSMIGSFPIECLQMPLPKLMRPFIKRLQECMTKAVREAKTHSNWLMPNEEYESAVYFFIQNILDTTRTNLFLDDFLPYALKIAERAVSASLGQVVLKYTIPGVPDIYQGAEMWELSFVDPDNRRPVDYDFRMATLAEPAPLSHLYKNWQDGQVKQMLIHRLLHLRNDYPALFAYGDYQQIEVKGGIVAFTRSYENTQLAVIVPLCGTWENIEVAIPDGNWQNIITNKTVSTFKLRELLNEFPAAILMRTIGGDNESNR